MTSLPPDFAKTIVALEQPGNTMEWVGASDWSSADSTFASTRRRRRRRSKMLAFRHGAQVDVCLPSGRQSTSPATEMTFICIDGISGTFCLPPDWRRLRLTARAGGEGA